jgi:small-conductance mechanosensitive channel
MDEREQIESALRYRIDDLFREAGLVMAFPQRDLHLDAAAPLPVRLVDR